MIRSRFLSLLAVLTFSVFITLSVCGCSPSTSSQPSSPASSPGQTTTPTPTAVADLYYFTRHSAVAPLNGYGPGPRIPILVWKGVSVTISDRRISDSGDEEVSIVRPDGGPEGWTSPDFLSSTPPSSSWIDVGIPIDINGLSYFSDDIPHGEAISIWPDYIRVYRFDGVSPQTGIDNAVAAMESVGWQSESSEAISKADLLKAHLLISGPPSLELANGLSSGKPKSRSADISWSASDPSYLQIWYFQSDTVE